MDNFQLHPDCFLSKSNLFKYILTWVSYNGQDCTVKNSFKENCGSISCQQMDNTELLRYPFKKTQAK